MGPTLSADGTTLYAGYWSMGGGGAQFASIRAADGTVNWRFQANHDSVNTGVVPFSAPRLAGADTVYLGTTRFSSSTRGKALAINAADGKARWSVDSGSKEGDLSWLQPTLSADKQTVYFVTGCSAMHGCLSCSFDDDDDDLSCRKTKHCIAVNATDGSVIWCVQLTSYMYLVSCAPAGVFG